MTIGRIPGANGIQPNIVDAKGDLIAATAADSVTRLAVGTNGQVLTADSAETTGLKWAAPDPLTTKGDLFTFSTTEARLPVGTNGHVLTADSAETTGLKWAAAAGGASFVGCALTKSGGQTISNNTATQITFDTETFDTDGFHSTVSNTSRITIPSGKGGYYLFNLTITYDNNTSGERQLTLIKNQTDPSGIMFKMTQLVPLSGKNTYSRSFIVNASAGDYFEMETYQTSGGNRTVEGNNERQALTSFQCQYLGA
jgi:hypothetical protein